MTRQATTNPKGRPKAPPPRVVTENRAVADGIEPQRPTRGTMDTDWLEERIIANVTLLKAIREMTDAEIAEAAGYNGRQSLWNRMHQLSQWTSHDIVRVAAALDVQTHVLLMDRGQLARWIEDNPNYKPPRYKRVPAKPRKARR